MGCKKTASWVCVLALLFAVDVSAQQNTESFWRVESSVSLTIVPPYAGEPSPFPVQQKPVIIQPEVPVDEISEQERAEAALAAERERQAAEIQNEIRKLVENETLFEPDMSGIAIKGQLTANGKPSVLMENQWIRVGQKARVPIRRAEKSFELLRVLGELNEELGKSMEQEIQEKIKNNSKMNITLTSISGTTAVFTDGRKQTHVISFTPTSW